MCAVNKFLSPNTVTWHFFFLREHLDTPFECISRVVFLFFCWSQGGTACCLSIGRRSARKRLLTGEATPSSCDLSEIFSHVAACMQGLRVSVAGLGVVCGVRLHNIL
mmetsp:Transcript_32671/g.87726  ORF Transcript_32671/g.87726 Transcript_32671/m.87726 type:complete len:107 (-) Transcript_32671:157-477(-)